MKNSEIRNIAVIGAGTMGNGIAQVFAQADYPVLLIDIAQEQLDAGRMSITKNLGRLVTKERIAQDVADKAISNITYATDISKSVATVDLVIEAATENLPLKLKIFKELDKHAPEHAILATNTSSISITTIASATDRPEKVIGMHFMNPVPIMPLVELIEGFATSNETTSSINNLAKELSKTPIVAQDYPGFVANRILMPMINEAIETLFQNVAGVKEIDGIMKLGMAHPMGPLQLADFIGLDVCLAILEVLYEGFKNPKYAPCPLLVNMVHSGKLGIKSKEGFYDYSTSSKAEIVASRWQ